MRFMPRTVIHSGLKWLGCMAVLLPLMTACETIMPVNSRVEQDVLEIKNKLNASLDRQASTEREISSQINSIADKQEQSSNLTVTSLDEIQRQIRSQNEELNKLRGLVEGLSIGMRDSRGSSGMPGNVTPPGNYGHGESTIAPPGVPNPAPMTTPPGPAEGGAAQIVAQATEMMNNGQYAQAKEAYTQALSQNPTGDLKVDILFGLGEACDKLNDPAGAQQSYDDTIRADRR